MTRWKPVAVAVLCGIAAAMHIGKVPPAIPLLRAEFSMSLVQAGWVMGLAAALGAACGLLVGRIADVLAPSRAMMIGLGLAVLGSLLGCLASGTTLLMASRVVESFGIILTIVAGPALVSFASDPDDRQMALGLWGLWLPTGVAAMMILSTVLLPVWGWRSGWLVAALASLTALVALASLERPAPVSGRTATPLVEGLRLTASRTTSWIIAGIFLTYSASFMAVFGFLPTLLTEDMHVGLNQASLLTALAVLGNAAGNVLGGILARRGVARWLLIALPCIALTVTAFLVFTPILSLPFRYAAAVVYAVCGGLLPATIMGALPVYAPRHDLVGTFSGFVMQGSNIGQCFGPMLLATVVAARGWPAAPYYIAAIMGVGLVLALALRGIEIRSGAVSPNTA